MLMVARFLLILFSVCTMAVFAQSGTVEYNNGLMTRPGFNDDPAHSHQSTGITVHQAAEIQLLSARFKAEHLGKNDNKGYRVQVYLGERGKAGDMKARVSEVYPDMPVEINYLAPNFRVRVGNFRSQLEADRFLRQIKGDFPNSYVVDEENMGLPALY